jgi:AmmeMemoRadiSam system protein B
MNKVIWCLFFFIFCVSANGFCQNIQKVTLAGAWYPDDPAALSQQIETYLKSAGTPKVEGDIVGFICPHAGIVYSGKVAAYGFKAVRDKNKDIQTVILVGFSHRSSYEGVAVFDKDGVQTPLGILYVEKELAKKIISQDSKIFSDTTVFEGENSVELILPFIQTAFPKAKVLLLAIGGQSFETCELLGEAIYQTVKGKDNYVIVASTDMSHYLLGSSAESIDSETAEVIEKMQPEELFSQCFGQNRMCGTGPVLTTMIAAKKLGADKVYILKKSTSAEVTGDSSRVVGYLSAAFVREVTEKAKESKNMKGLLNAQQKKELLKIAHDTITQYIERGVTFEPKAADPMLKEKMGVFVTLHKNGELRGCIGNIIGTEPLYLGVRNMAISAAVEDPRFPAVTARELKDIDIEISVLSP